MRRWWMVLIAALSALAMTVTAPSAGAVDAPIGHIGDTLRVHMGDVIADVTVLPVVQSEIPLGWGYPPRPPREQVWKAPVVVHAVAAPNPYVMSAKFSFRGVTPTGDAYEPRNTDAPDDLRTALRNAPAGSTVGGTVFWDCYRDLPNTVVLIDKQTGFHLAQWSQ